MEALGFTSGRVLTDRGRLYTESSCPGKRVYGERLVRHDGKELREWDPRRSKLGAYLSVGGTAFPFTTESRVLYLGAPRLMSRTYAAKGRCTASSSHRGCSETS